MKNTNKILLFIIIVFVISFVAINQRNSSAGTGFFGGSSKSGSSVESKIDGWDVYTNEEEGFEIDYPDSYSVQIEEDYDTSYYDEFVLSAEDKWVQKRIANFYLSDRGYEAKNSPGFTVDKMKFYRDITSVEEMLAELNRGNNFEMIDRYINAEKWTELNVYHYQTGELNSVSFYLHKNGEIFHINTRDLDIDGDMIHRIVSTIVVN